MKNNHRKIKKIDYDYIIDGIFIGTNQCCQMDFDKMLLQRKITADISLEKERLDAPFGVEFYVWIPVEDHTAPTLDQLEFGVSVLEKIIAMKKKVYVHCKRGHGRAPTLVAAYLMKMGKTLNETIKFLKSKRPAIHLRESQIAALKKWINLYSLSK